MAIKDQQFDELVALIRSSDRPVVTGWSGEFVIGDNLYDFTQIQSINRVCDYEEALSDELTVVIKLPLSLYEQHLYPARDILHVTLRRSVIVGQDGEVDPDSDIIERQYKALMSEAPNPDLQGNTSSDGDRNLIDVTFQCIDPLLYALLYTRVGGIFYNNDPLSVLTYYLGTHSEQVEVSKENQVKGLQVTPYEVDLQKRIKKHLIIPQGTPLLQLHDKLHQAYGIYNHGINIYLQHGYWYVYPVYRTNRYSDTETTLDVLVIGKQQNAGMNRSYAIKDKKLFITVDTIEHKDIKEQAYLNVGNGVRYLKASSSWNEWVTVSQNKATTQPDTSIEAYVMDERKDTLSNVPFSQQRVTDNSARQSSIMAKRKGQLVMAVWDNSDPQLLYPGMPLRVRYNDLSGERVVEGTLLRVTSSTGLAQGGLVDSNYTTTTHLAMWVEEK